jgi:hypothetical protein
VGNFWGVVAVGAMSVDTVLKCTQATGMKAHRAKSARTFRMFFLLARAGAVDRECQVRPGILPQNQKLGTSSFAAFI